MYWDVFLVILFILSIPDMIGKRLKFSGLYSLLILFFAFSSNLLNGVDWIHYYSRFNSYSLGMEFSGLMEPLFSSLMYTVTKVTANYQHFVIIVNAIFLSIVFIAVKRISHKVSLTLFLIYGFYGLGLFNEQIRQAIAFAIVTFAMVEYINNAKRNKYVLLVITASLFHVSALSMIIVLFVKKLVVSKHLVLPYIMIAIVTSVFLESVLSLIIYLGILPSLAIKKLIFYSEQMAIGSTSFGFFFLFDLLWIYLLTIIYNTLDDRGGVLCKIAILFCFCHIVFYSFPPLQRVTVYFYIANLLLTSELISRKMRKSHIIFCATTLLYVFYYYYSYQSSPLSKSYFDYDIYIPFVSDSNYNELRYERCKKISEIDPFFCFNVIN